METSNPFEKLDTGFPGLVLLRARRFEDARGSFVKTFHARFFEQFGISFRPREEFFSVSARNVVRGMHFQVPPAQHAKLVYCPQGRALDVAVDLRRRSPRYGQVFSRELGPMRRARRERFGDADPDAAEVLYLPAGFAHGFLSLEDGTIMVYQTDVAHTPECDAGIAWDSIGFEWPVRDVVLSKRDRNWPGLESFVSPFEGGV